MRMGKGRMRACVAGGGLLDSTAKLDVLLLRAVLPEPQQGEKVGRRQA